MCFVLHPELYHKYKILITKTFIKKNKTDFVKYFYILMSNYLSSRKKIQAAAIKTCLNLLLKNRQA